MVFLSDFLKTLIVNYKWFAISARSNNGCIGFLTGELETFYNNVFIEKLLTNNFLYLDIKISYKFPSKNKLDRELVNNTASCFVELYNSSENRVCVKNAVVLLRTRNMWLERKIINFSERNDNCIKFICLEDRIYDINKLNDRKPFKISVDRFTKVYTDDKTIINDYQNHYFNLKQYYSIKISIIFFNKNIIATYEIILSLDNIENYLKSVSNQLNKINSIFTKNKETRSLVSFLKNHSVTISDFHIIDKAKQFTVEICPIKLFTTTYHQITDFQSNIDINYYYKLLNIIYILKKQYETINNDNLKPFWNLIHTIARINNNKQYENHTEYNNMCKRFSEIFPKSIYGRVVTKVIIINDIKVNLFFNMTKNESLEMIHHIYSEEAESQLEKFLMTIGD